MDEYQKLAEVFGFPGSARLARILQMLMTPEEARWLARLPATPGQLAQALDCTSEEARKALQGLAAKGFALAGEVTPTGTLYKLVGIGWLGDQVLANPQYERLGTEFYDLWRDFFNEEQIPQDQQRIKEPTPAKFRVLPAEGALPAEGVRDYERASWIVGQARVIAMAKCPCRRRERRCDHELEVCLWLNDVGEYAISQGIAQAISRDEAMAILERCSQNGLVHDTENSSQPNVICNCCSCCCAFLRPRVAYELELPIATSRYQARLDESLCVDCGICLERCHFGALEARNGHPIMRADKCIGCGLCVIACPSGALSLVIAREVATSDTGAPLAAGQAGGV